VVEDLPPIERTVETVNLNADARLHLTKLGEALRSGGLRPHASNVGEIAHARRVLGHAKWMSAAQLVERYLAGDESVVVWTWHKEIADKIYEYLKFTYNAYIVTGDVNASSRDRIFEEWRMSTPSVLVITLAVGQVGIDLSHARHAIFAEQDWTPAVVSQAEYRTFSPTRPMTVDHVVAEHPVDVRIVSALIKKCRLAGKMGLSAAETEMELLSNAIDNEELDITFAGLLECDLEGEDNEGY
jgi:SWI/SNF-related matrix-associated actin-dependent regulator 1 of chromatin subfamily A